MYQNLIVFKEYNGEKINKSFSYDKKDEPLVYFLNKKAKYFVGNRVTTVKSIYIKNKFAGYFAIAMSSIDAADLYDEKRAATFPHPCIKIGRILIDKKHRKKGIGKAVILHVIHLGQVLNKFCSCRFIVVDAKNGVEEFYLKTGFMPVRIEKQKFEETTTMLFDLKI